MGRPGVAPSGSSSKFSPSGASSDDFLGGGSGGIGIESGPLLPSCYLSET